MVGRPWVRIFGGFSLVVLTWNPLPLSCGPHHFEVWDLYIEASGDVSEGVAILPPTVTSRNVAPSKPEPGSVPCAIGWGVRAVYAGVPLPAVCQPTGVRADGVAWPGI